MKDEELPHRPIEYGVDFPADCAEALARQRWTYARTMPLDAHSYVKHWDDSIMPHDVACRKIVELGREEEYVFPFGKGSHMQRYVVVDGYRYWVMGWEEIVAGRNRWGGINRAVERYGDYAERPSGSALYARQHWYGKKAKGLLAGRVLDISCGEGFLVDYNYVNLASERYVGIDTDGELLSYFGRKHPEYASSLVHVGLTECCGSPFDTVLSMFRRFGSDEEMMRTVSLMRRWLKPGGTAWLHVAATKEQAEAWAMDGQAGLVGGRAWQMLRLKA